MGDKGVETLVKGLIKIHKSGQVSPEEMEAIKSAAHDIVADVMGDALNSSSLESMVSAGSNQSGSKGSTGEIVAAMESKSASGLRLRQLDIGDCQMTNKGAAQIARLISANTPISNLSLTGNKDITEEGWEAIADALKFNRHIVTLSLDYNRLSDTGAALIAGALKVNKTLKSLDLEGNKIGDLGAEKILAAMSDNTTIQDVTLMPGNNIKETLLMEIRELLLSRTGRT